MEKEDPASALDCLIAQLMSAPSSTSSTNNSMAEAAAADFLKGFKQAAFDQDLFKALEEDLSVSRVNGCNETSPKSQGWVRIMHLSD